MKLSKKFLLLFLLFINILFICLLIFLYYFENQKYKQESSALYRQTVADVTSICNQMIENQNPGGLYSVLKNEMEIRAVYAALAYFRILTNSGIIYFSMNEKEQNKLTNYDRDLSILQKSAHPEDLIANVYKNNLGAIYDVSAFFANNTGKYIIRAGFLFSSDVQFDKGNLAVLFLLITLISVVFAFLIKNIIVLPIETLTREAMRIARGKIKDFSLHENREDEIGDLARSLKFPNQSGRLTNTLTWYETILSDCATPFPIVPIGSITHWRYFCRRHYHAS